MKFSEKNIKSTEKRHIHRQQFMNEKLTFLSQINPKSHKKYRPQPNIYISSTKHLRGLKQDTKSQSSERLFDFISKSELQKSERNLPEQFASENHRYFNKSKIRSKPDIFTVTPQAGVSERLSRYAMINSNRYSKIKPVNNEKPIDRSYSEEKKKLVATRVISENYPEKSPKELLNKIKQYENIILQQKKEIELMKIKLAKKPRMLNKSLSPLNSRVAYKIADHSLDDERKSFWRVRDEDYLSFEPQKLNQISGFKDLWIFNIDSQQFQTNKGLTNSLGSDKPPNLSKTPINSRVKKAPWLPDAHKL